MATSSNNTTPTPLLTTVPIRRAERADFFGPEIGLRS
jgi:hypothetical protein